MEILLIMNKEPNWGYYFSTLSFDEFKNRSPFLNSKNTPTIYSEGKQWLYLGSFDIGINVHDCANMEKILHDFESCNNLESGGKSLYKRAQIESDIELLKELVQNCDGS
mgnify:FL=1